MSIETLEDIQDELEDDSRFDTRLQKGILTVDSESWMTIPASGIEPTEVQVVKADKGINGEQLFSVRPVDSGAEALSILPEEAVSYIKRLTE